MDNKPITILRQEFADQICDLVNNSPLPSFIIRYVLRDLDAILEKREQMEYARDTRESARKEDTGNG